MGVEEFFTSEDINGLIGERQKFNMTETGNAERLVARHGASLRYCWPWGKWLVWDGCRWKVDDTGEVQRRAKDTVRSMYWEASSIADEDERKKFLKFVLRAEQLYGSQAMVKLAANEPGIPVLPVELDNNHWVLNVYNGTLDLRSGKLGPHRPQDMLTKLVPVKYDPAARCPRWEQFLLEIMGGNEDLVGFLQRAVGMSLTGDVSNHCMIILYGEGRNGKSTFLGVLQELLGDYALQAPPDILMARKLDSHPTELTDLFGRRLVVAIESGKGRRLAEPLIKQLTGGDKIRARRMREDFWEFLPTHKLWLATNDKPVVRGTDLGIWSRLKLVPFNASYPDDDPRQDKQLGQKLLAELPGILRWAVDGCLAWQAKGLGVPEAVIAATEEYREGEDVVGCFIAECCMVNPLAKVSASLLYREYRVWCHNIGERAESQTAFGRSLARRGFESVRSGKSGNVERRGLKMVISGVATERSEGLPWER